MPPIQQDSSGIFSPIRILSDASSDGLPSPEALKQCLFLGQTASTSKSPLRRTTVNDNVIVLDDTPPSAGCKQWDSQTEVNGAHTVTTITSSTSKNADSNKTIIDSHPRSLTKEFETISEVENARNRKILVDNELSQKEQKAQRRLQKKREREVAKEKKEAEKKRRKELKDANAIRQVSTDTLHDTILCLDKAIYDSDVGVSIRTQLADKEAEIIRTEDEFENAIRWQRKSRAEWDNSSQSFQPYDHGEVRVISEKQVALWMDMQRFTTMIEANELLPHLTRVQSRLTTFQIIIVLEGLQKYYKERKNRQSRSLQNTILQNIANEDGRSATAKKSRTPKSDWINNGPDRNVIEDILLSLQLTNRIMVIHTIDHASTASWIVTLSATIATNAQGGNDLLDFCSDGRMRSGVDLTDTWLKMLQNIQKCTDAVAKAIVREYPTMRSLYDAYTRCTSVHQAEMLLADIEVERSVITNRDRFINKAMSKKIYTIIMSDDHKMVIA